MAYLDNTGLSYLWGKLKDMFSDKISKTSTEDQNMSGRLCWKQNNRPAIIIGTVIEINSNIGEILVRNPNSFNGIVIRQDIIGFEANDSNVVKQKVMLKLNKDKTKLSVYSGNVNSTTLGRIEIGNAIDDDDATTLGQVKQLISDAVGSGGISPVTRTVTLSSGGWANNTQTVTVEGISATETEQVIQPVPANANQAAYMEAGIYASGQAADSLTFTCQTAPTTNLTVYVLIQNLA